MDTISVLLSDDLTSESIQYIFDSLRQTKNYYNVYYNVQVISDENKRKLLANQYEFPIIFSSKTEVKVGTKGLQEYINSINYGEPKRKIKIPQTEETANINVDGNNEENEDLEHMSIDKLLKNQNEDDREFQTSIKRTSRTHEDNEDDKLVIDMGAPKKRRRADNGSRNKPKEDTDAIKTEALAEDIINDEIIGLQDPLKG